MRTRQRLKGLQKWLEENLCAGREMKAPPEKGNITKIVRQEPKVYLGWYPSRPDANGYFTEEAHNVCPGIIVMPAPSKAKAMEEKRFDRYNHVHRPPSLGQTLAVDILFSVYEPGIRLPGFVDNPQDLSLIREGTEEGLFTLTDWMDECMEKLLAVQNITGTDLFLDEDSFGYSLYSDQDQVVDRRPLFYGFLRVTFGGYAHTGRNDSIDNFLK